MSNEAKILIADDHPHGVELLEAYLAAADYEVKTASNGEETLKIVESWKPDLILLDIMMPRMSGFEVCKTLRANEATRDIAVIMVTALDQPSDVERAVEAGCDDFITKPINQQEMLKRVAAMLKARTQREPDRTLSYLESMQQEPS
ncbi:response regulator [Tuwongella immobilis]|uniref:Response regulatory domain-containing protein n=1 Tax=Tuwongella immobilis TaxID=692036 RepID=A0A6C2YNE7_9BACT|nr:response regulator [Tuwongella immobilis]VIP02585.1 chemotaxis protein : Response regulator receiver protein OS=Isosphaera pallida (strain ATCC 43644 / DSM 9630 / IS1B) GN=Isop_2462 PE=4 SV=1: Response_reg [Tuwongella immobilis]VTS01843.1 chemotaxis protein : Response regulator receiver protein OS=Isosphaera pallida (strain ATCC 43644 / DSM 9630 / IS1B) GN=Isop_2462 PE=4 SV=1: Response_reg [Tuwongella immobilis]